MLRTYFVNKDIHICTLYKNRFIVYIHSKFTRLFKRHIFITYFSSTEISAGLENNVLLGNIHSSRNENGFIAIPKRITGIECGTFILGCVLMCM